MNTLREALGMPAGDSMHANATELPLLLPPAKAFSAYAKRLLVLAATSAGTLVAAAFGIGVINVVLAWPRYAVAGAMAIAGCLCLACQGYLSFRRENEFVAEFHRHYLKVLAMQIRFLAIRHREACLRAEGEDARHKLELQALRLQELQRDTDTLIRMCIEYGRHRRGWTTLQRDIMRLSLQIYKEFDGALREGIREGMRENRKDRR